MLKKINMAKAQYDRSELPVEALEKLNEILLQDPEGLNVDDAAFLRARRDYLNGGEKERFAAVLEEEKKAEPKKQEPKAAAPAAPKK